MKNVFKLFGITVMAAVIVFAMAGCDNGASPDPGIITDPLSLDGMNLKDFGTTEGITYLNVSNKNEWDDAWASITSAGNYVINVTANLDEVSFDLNDDCYPANGFIISLRGGDYNLTTSEDVYIDSGETLILRGVTITFSDNGSRVDCDSGSTLVMEAGSTITGGFGVYCSHGSTLVMEDGSAITC